MWITDKGSNYPTHSGELTKALPKCYNSPGFEGLVGACQMNKDSWTFVAERTVCTKYTELKNWLCAMRMMRILLCFKLSGQVGQYFIRGDWGVR